MNRIESVRFTRKGALDGRWRCIASDSGEDLGEVWKCHRAHPSGTHWAACPPQGDLETFDTKSSAGDFLRTLGDARRSDAERATRERETFYVWCKAEAARIAIESPRLVGEDVQHSTSRERMEALGERHRWEVLQVLLMSRGDPEKVRALANCEGPTGHERFHAYWWFAVNVHRVCHPPESADVSALMVPAADLVERGLMMQDALKFFIVDQTDPFASDRRWGRRWWLEIREEMNEATKEIECTP